MAVAKFSLAVDRRFAKKDKDQQTADFINCTAFRNTAEFIEKYFRKGMKAVVFGRIQTGSYKNKEGNTVHTTDVVVEEIEFGESKQQNRERSQQRYVSAVCTESGAERSGRRRIYEYPGEFG